MEDFKMRFVSLLVIVPITITSALQGASVLTDSTFNLANYSESPVFGTSVSDSTTFSQCSTCGNPGQALQIDMTLPTGSDTGAIGFADNTFSYNPSTQGAILTIDASVDKNIITNIPIDPSDAFGNTFRPLIEQDGTFYLAAIAGPTFDGGTTGFNTISQSGLQASDFLSYDFTTGTFGTANPNFAGDPILLGIGQIAQFSNASVDFTAIYDNLSLTVNTVPEPSEFLPIMVALAGFAYARRSA
jgi:hypothetical protein